MKNFSGSLARSRNSYALRVLAAARSLALVPLVYTVIQLSWPLVVRAYVTNEYSSNAGGLIRWPVFALLPLGFLLLGIQAISELIKRIAFLKGLVPDPTQKPQGKTAEEELAEDAGTTAAEYTENS